MSPAAAPSPAVAIKPNAPDISIIVPVYNRGDRIRWTLESIRRASSGLRVETIVIDDGSTPPLQTALAGLSLDPLILHRQENQGLLFARLAGFARATGEYTLFLDSDDLLHPEKLSRQIAAMRATDADVSYSDEAAVPLDDTWSTAPATQLSLKPCTSDTLEFFMRLQPAPHNPIFRTAYLRLLLQNTWVPPSPHFNAVAEIWFYYLCAAARPARIVKCDGPLTLQGLHPGIRLSSHWEKLAVGSLAVLQAFARLCPVTKDTELFRSVLAERLFLAWRALPYDTPAAVQNRFLAALDTLPAPPLNRCGGTAFGWLARLSGRRLAALCLRRFQRPSYQQIQTLPPGEFARLANLLPPS